MAPAPKTLAELEAELLLDEGLTAEEAMERHRAIAARLRAEFPDAKPSSELPPFLLDAARAGSAGGIKAATVSGAPMRFPGMEDGDALLAERGAEPRSGDLLLVAMGGREPTAMLLRVDGSRRLLRAADGADEIDADEVEGLEILGVVTVLARSYLRH